MVCPHCGTVVSPASQFCSICGTNLLQTQRPHRHWGRWLTASLFVTSLVVVGGFAGQFYRQQIGRQYQIDLITEAITANQSHLLASRLVAEDPSLRITSDTVQPFLTYTRLHPHYVSVMRHDLRQAGKTRDNTFKLVTARHIWGILPVYKIEVTAMYPRIRTNVTGATIMADQTALLTAKSPHFQGTTGPLFPGQYTFTLNGILDPPHATVNLMGQNDRSRNITLNASTPLP